MIKITGGGDFNHSTTDNKREIIALRAIERMIWIDPKDSDKIQYQCGFGGTLEAFMAVQKL